MNFDRDKLLSLLVERGVTSAVGVVDSLGDDLDGAFATIAYYDDQPVAKQGAGLLVYLLKEGGMGGYRRPHEREKVQATSATVTPQLLASIRGSCLSPNGYTREDARGMLDVKAKHLHTSPDALVDAAMGPDWQETPVHPVLRHDGTPRERFVRYAHWVAEA